MTTNFPSSIDNFTNPTSSSTMASPSHSAQHADVNDAVEALQAKVGVDGSAVTSSLDYKVANQGLTLVKTVSIGSGVTSVTVTDAFSATFENYKVLTNIENASANNDVYFRLGGVSTNTYDRTRQLWFVASTTPGYGAETAQTAGWWGVNRTGEGSDTVSEIFRPYIAKPTTVKSEAFYKDIAGQMQFRLHASIQRGDLSHTSLTLLVSSGTMSNGTIRVYGYNNG